MCPEVTKLGCAGRRVGLGGACRPDDKGSDLSKDSS
jgi:hypothetical protein